MNICKNLLKLNFVHSDECTLFTLTAFKIGVNCYSCLKISWRLYHSAKFKEWIPLNLAEWYNHNWFQSRYLCAWSFTSKLFCGIISHRVILMYSLKGYAVVQRNFSNSRRYFKRRLLFIQLLLSTWSTEELSVTMRIDWLITYLDTTTVAALIMSTHSTWKMELCFLSAKDNFILKFML